MINLNFFKNKNIYFLIIFFILSNISVTIFSFNIKDKRSFLFDTWISDNNTTLKINEKSIVINNNTYPMTYELKDNKFIYLNVSNYKKIYIKIINEDTILTMSEIFHKKNKKEKENLDIDHFIWNKDDFISDNLLKNKELKNFIFKENMSLQIKLFNNKLSYILIWPSGKKQVIKNEFYLKASENVLLWNISQKEGKFEVLFNDNTKFKLSKKENFKILQDLVQVILYDFYKNKKDYLKIYDFDWKLHKLNN